MKSRLLIVEDDPITRFMMAEICEQLGYPHEIAHDGAHCLQMLSARPDRADIVLLDIHMPGISGLDTCARLREGDANRKRGLAIIALTADEFWHDPQNCAAAGFDNVLPKPISINGLREVLTLSARPELKESTG